MVKIVCYCYMRNGSEPLRGAVVSLYDKDGLLEQHSTDFTGRCAFLNLKPGEYTARQTHAPRHALASRTAHRICADCRCLCIEVGFASERRFADIEGVESPEARAKINELRNKAKLL